jgi:hypothetical protein
MVICQGFRSSWFRKERWGIYQQTLYPKRQTAESVQSVISTK